MPKQQLRDYKPDHFGGRAQPSPNDGDKPEDAPLPASVKLAAPYGFIDDESGEHRYWQAGQEVTNPEEIKLLIERQAPLE